jgi:hypothetical protein
LEVDQTSVQLNNQQKEQVSMTIEDDSFSLIWQEIEQGMKMQYLASLKCDPTTNQENISANSNQDPMKEVYRTGRSRNIVAHPTLHKIRGRFVGGLHTKNYTNPWDE